MSLLNFKDQSKRNWANPENQDVVDNEEIQIGCLQRIADATEVMARDRVKLERDLKWTEERRDYWRDQAERLERKNAALRGVITKLKNKAKLEA